MKKLWVPLLCLLFAYSFSGCGNNPTNQIAESKAEETPLTMAILLTARPIITWRFFYAQTDNPVLSVDVIPIGRVTSDLSVFENLESRVEITFSLAE